MFPPRTRPDPLNSRLAQSNAEAAFDAYFEETGARFGTPFPVKAYGENPNWPVFLQLAVICAARGWDPSDYVRSLFRFRGAECILVGDLVKKRMVDSYHPNPFADDAKEEYERCVELLIQGETSGSDERSLLLSPLSPFPAWFRAFYPEELDMQIVNAWGQLARQEIAQSSHLIEFLKVTSPEKWERLRKVLWFYGNPEGGAK